MSIEELVGKRLVLVADALVMAARADIKQANGCGLPDDEMVDIVIANAIHHILYTAELVPQ